MSVFFSPAAEAIQIDTEFASSMPWDSPTCITTQLFKQLADQGNATAQHMYSLYREARQGLEIDFGLAAHYCKLSAVQALARGQLNSGRCVDKGIGAGADLELFRYYCHLAAEHGHVTALYECGLHLLHNGVEPDLKTAAKNLNSPLMRAGSSRPA
jgi:TPR repeat protein